MTNKTNKGQCESTLKSLVKSAQFAYGCNEDEAYEVIKEVLKKPVVLNIVRKAFEQGTKTAN